MNKLEDFNEHQVCKKATVDYIISPAPTVSDGDVRPVDKGTVVYCIDISGSMSVTTQMPGLQGNYLIISPNYHNCSVGIVSAKFIEHNQYHIIVNLV